MTKYETEADVLRDTKWVRIPSNDIAPGDVVRLRSEWLLPCDLVLLSGTAHPQ